MDDVVAEALEISTSPELLAALKRAKAHTMTPEERFEQRVSFVYGQCWDSGLSKEEIRQRLRDMG